MTDRSKIEKRPRGPKSKIECPIRPIGPILPSIRRRQTKLEINEALAAQTYKFMIPDNKSFRLEGIIDGPGMAEMIRLLAEDKLIPEKKPWKNFIDAGFLPAIK